MVKASRYQGGGNFKKVIDLSEKALKINPKSYTAFLMLADDYPRMGEIEKAKNILNKALSVYPNSWQFNYIMAEVIRKNEDPMENSIPYLKKYLEHRPQKKGNFPFFMKWFLYIFGKKINWDKYEEELDRYNDSQFQWASKIVSTYDKKANKRIMMEEPFMKIPKKTVVFLKQNPSKNNLTLKGLLQEKVISTEDYKFLIKNEIKYNPPSSVGPHDNYLSIFDRNNENGTSNHIVYNLVDISDPNITKTGTLTDLDHFLSEWYGYNSTKKSLNLFKDKNLYYFTLHYWDNDYWEKQNIMLINFPVDKTGEIEKFKELMNDNDLRYRDDNHQEISSFTVWLPSDFPFIKKLSNEILVNIYLLSQKDVINYTPDGFRFGMMED